MARTTIRSEDIADSEISTAKIADDAVNSAKIPSGAVQTGEIADNAINVANMAGTLDLSSNTVTLPAASVTAHAVSFNDVPIRNDIATLALHSAISDDRVAFNLSNAFVDQFQDDTGLDVETSTDRHSSEYVKIAVGAETLLAHDVGTINSSNFTVGVGQAYLYDGTHSTDAAPSASGTPGWVIYDFGAGNAKVLTKTIHYGREYSGGYGGYGYYDPSITTTISGSNDNSSYTSIGAVTFTDTVHPQPITITHSSSTAYRYIKTSLSAGDIMSEVQHYHVPDVPAGNFTSVTQTALATVSKMSIIVLYKNTLGTATLNTDLVASVSSNGGTNYNAATLTAGGTFSTGILIAKSNDITISNTGTAPKYKIAFANQATATKATEIHGVALLY